ncbi:unnamed protein product [Dicrocoelium dendriticum]|nr:unnamed protein product [Dicrocoelium dendriticum]
MSTLAEQLPGTQADGSPAEDSSGICRSLAFLTTGTAVSAKYRGAYCEATVDQVDLRFRLRVQLKGEKNVFTVDQNGLMSGEPNPGSEVIVKVPLSGTVRHPGSASTLVERTATVLRAYDTSLYTVVFDDGDKRTLRRTQLVLKGERHFKESESLDCLPLTNPEQFRQPVIDQRKHRLSEADLQDIEDELHDCGEAEKCATDVNTTGTSRVAVAECVESNSNQLTAASASSVLADGTQQHAVLKELASSHSHTTEKSPKCDPVCTPLYSRFLGKLVLVNMPIGTKDLASLPSNLNDTNVSSNISVNSDSASRRRFTPGLVVLPTAMPGIDLRPVSFVRGKRTKSPVLLVRSFRDNRFMPVPSRYAKRLKRPRAVELAHAHPSLRNAFERALLWLDRYELPASWGEDAMQTLLGTKNWRAARREYHKSRSSHPHSERASRKRLYVNSSEITSGEDSHGLSPPISSQMNSNLSASRKQTSTPRKSVGSKTAARKRARVSNTVGSLLKKREPKRLKLRRTSGKKSCSSNGDSDSEPTKHTGNRQHLSTSKRVSKNKLHCSDDSGSDSSSSSSDNDLQPSDSSSTQSSDSSSSSEPVSSSSSPSSVDFEARDRWIAQLYRFMDEGGTPINKAPSLANKDLDLYKLYRLVRDLGGFHRVTAQLKWGYIYSKLRLPHNFTAGPRNLQAAFKRYLYPLDDISRKLGTDLDALPLSRPRHAAPSTSFTNSGSKSSTVVCRGANSAALSTAAKSSSSEIKPSDKSSGTKPVLTATERLPVCETSMERTSERTIESSPPVLSPPVLGCTPSPSDDWASTSMDLTPLKGARRQQISQSEKQPKCEPEDGSGSAVTHIDRNTKKRNLAPTTDKHSTDAPPKNASAINPISSDSSSLSGSSVVSAHPEKKTNRSIRANRMPLFLNLPDDFGTLSDQTASTNLNQVIPVGSRVRVRCGDRVAYEAKVLKHIRPQAGLAVGRGAESSFTNTWSEPTELQYRVHYLGWNTRHDEVVSRSRIVSVIEWAHSAYGERAPSCSSLNIVVQQSRKAGRNGHRKALSTSTCMETQGHIGLFSVTQPKNGNNATTSYTRRLTKEGDIEEDGESDLSHTTETASDIVTTLAPMVRRRRSAFDAGDVTRKRSKMKPESTKAKAKHSSPNVSNDGAFDSAKSHVNEPEKVVVKRETDSPGPDKSEPNDSSGVTLCARRASRSGALSKRIKPTPYPNISDVQTAAKPPQSLQPKVDESGFSVDSVIARKAMNVVDSGATVNTSDAKRMEDKSTVSNLKRQKTKLGLSLRGHKRLLPSTGEKIRALMNQSFKRSARKRGAQTSSAITGNLSSGNANAESSCSSNSIQTSKSADRKCQSDIASRRPIATNCATPAASDHSRKKLDTEPNPMKLKADIDKEDTNSPENSVKSVTARPTPPRKESAVSETISSKRTVAQKIRACRGAKTEGESSTTSEPLHRNLKPSTLATLDHSGSFDIKDEFNGASNHRTVQRSSHSQRSRSTARKLTLDLKDKSTGRQSGPARKSARSAASDVDSGSDDSKLSSSHSGDTDSSESGFGAIDALPRLTRNQHRQLLGDTPPGAALQTASPVSTGSVPSVAVKSDSNLAIREAACTESKPEVKTDTITVLHTDTSQRLSAASATLHETSFYGNETSNLSPIRTASSRSDSIDSPQPSPSQPDQVVADSKHDKNSEHSDQSSSICAHTTPLQLSKLQPRTKSCSVSDIAFPPQSMEHAEASPKLLMDSSSGNDDEHSSVHTMSIDPVRDVMFDFTMSPSEGSPPSSSVASASASSKRDMVDIPSQLTLKEHGYGSENDDFALSQSPNHEHTSEPPFVDHNGREVEDHAEQQTHSTTGEKWREGDQTYPKTKPRPDRVRRVSTNESAEYAARKIGKRAPASDHRSAVSEKSPTPNLDSPHYPRSPVVPTTTSTGVIGTATASVGSKGGQPAVAPPTRLAPSQRRFGGPFFPIPGFDEMDSETRCIHLQDRMHRILEAWRSAKQCLKDLDQRANRTRRLRIRQSTTDAPPTTPSLKQTTELDAATCSTDNNTTEGVCSPHCFQVL